jgi:predicted DNA-binding protein
MPAKKHVMSSMYLTPAAHRALAKLCERTRVPRAVLVREAIDDLLKKYRRVK